MASTMTITLPNGEKRYEVRWRDPAGKQKAKRFKKQKVAQRFCDGIGTQLHDHTYVSVQPAPMAEVFDKWLASMDMRMQEGSLRASTMRSYRSVVNEHLREHFATTRSDRLSLGAVEAWRKALAAKVVAGDMTPKMLVNVRNILSAVIKWARHPSRGYLAHDPMAGMERLRLPRSKRRPHFEPEQLAELLRLASATPSQDAMIIRLVVLSGLRRGEAFGLKWPDVDLATGELHVRGTLDAVTHVVVGTKTEDSERVVAIPDELRDALSIHRLEYPELGDGFVFRQADGGPFDPDRWHKRVLVPLLKAAGLRLPRTGLHSIRHSYVSILGAQGADLRFIADQVGHSTTRLTADLYTHVLKARRHEAVQRLGVALNKNSTEQAATPETQG